MMIRTCVLAVAALAGAAQADLMRLDTGAYSFGNGGEFNATILTGPVVGDSVSGTPYFETFCLEKSENFHPGNVYSFDIGTSAVGGGAGGSVNGADPLDSRTAYLYAAFIDGLLPGYDYTNSLGQRQAHGGALQNAIWYLEEEVGTLDTPLAVAFFNFASAGANLGLGDVRVMNLYTLNNAGERVEAQSQLIKIVPAPGAIVALGMAGLLSARRRR